MLPTWQDQLGGRARSRFGKHRASWVFTFAAEYNAANPMLTVRLEMKIIGYCATLLLLLFGLIVGVAEQNTAEQQDLGNTPGVLHNEAVDFVLQHLQTPPSPAEARPLIIQLIKEFCVTRDLNCSSLSLPPVLPTVEEVLAGIHGSETFKTDLKLIIQLMAKIRKNPNVPALSLQQFEISLTDLETTVAARLRPAERIKFLGAVSVARMSALFWAPTEEGGLNRAQFLNISGVDWGFVVLFDVLGYLEGLEGGPEGGAINAASFSVYALLNFE